MDLRNKKNINDIVEIVEKNYVEIKDI